MMHLRILWAFALLITLGSYNMGRPDSSQPGWRSTAVQSVSVGARPRAFTFVQLVFGSQWIALGKVTATSAQGGTPVTLSVERSVPAGLTGELRVVSNPSEEGSPANFSANERVVLFLEKVSRGEGKLLGSGDAAVWPRQAPNWLFSAGHVQPIAEVMKVIDLLVSINARKTYEGRVYGLVNELVPTGPLGRIAAAEYAADRARWSGAESVPDGPRAARLLVAERFLLTPEPPEPTLDIWVVQLLSSAPSSVAVPALIAHLDDPEVAVRDTAFSTLQTQALPYTEDKFGYGRNDPPEERRAAIRKWQQWWAGQRGACLRHDVPRFLQDLGSTYVLTRRAADSSLRLLSEREVGYRPEETGERQREAVQRWHAWWEEFARHLN